MVLEAFTHKLKNGLKFYKQGVPTVSDCGDQLDTCLDTVVQWVAQKYGKEYFVKSLESFSTNWGKADPEDTNYQDRINYFLENCVLESGIDKTIQDSSLLKKYLAANSQPVQEDQDVWRVFSNYRHSLFEVISAGDRQIVLKDFLNSKKYYVTAKSSETLKFLNKKSIIQAFLFIDKDTCHLGQGLIIHPLSVRRLINQKIKYMKTKSILSEGAFLQLIASTQMRYLRMQHVDPVNLYAKYLESPK